MTPLSIVYILVFVLNALSAGGNAKPVTSSSSVASSPYQTDEIMAMVPEMSHKFAPSSSMSGQYESMMMAPGVADNVIDPIRTLQNLVLFYNNGQDKNWKKLGGFYSMLSGQQKRQIRYQQCYFNPISCFRR